MSNHDAELHSIILQNIAEGVCLVRISDQTIVYANPRFEQIFGYDPGELVGHPVTLLNYGETEADAAATARAIIDVLEREGSSTYEVHNRKKDGTPFWCRAHTSRFVHPEYGPVWVAVQADITAEKEALERLRSHERLLNAVIEALPVGLWIADRSGHLQSGNPAALRIWGGARYVGPEEFGAYQAWRVDTGAPLAAEDWGVTRAIRSGETSIGELLRIRGFDGVERTIINSVMPLRDGDAVVGALAVNEDVTRLIEAEMLFAGVVAAAPDAIVVIDCERRIIVFNAGAERIFGHPRDEVLGHDIARLFAADHRAALEALLASAASGEAGEPRPIVACRNGGHSFPAEVSAACTHSGTLRRCTLVLRDTTARMRAEDERDRLARTLAAERSWLHALISTVPVAIATIDRDKHVTFNPGAERLFGFRSEERSRESYLGIARYPDGTPVPLDELPLSLALRGETTRDVERIIVRPNGTRRWTLGAAAPVLDATGQLLGAVGALQDITAQKQLEQDLRFVADAGKALAESLDYEATLRTFVQLVVPALADGCIIHICDESGAVQPAAYACNDPDQQRALTELLARAPQLGWSAGAARVQQTGEPALVPDLPRNDLEALTDDPAQQILLRRIAASSYLTVPLRVHEATIGTITLFDTTSGRRVDRHDLDLVDILGRRAGLAIEKARLYRASRRATRARDDMLSIVAHDLRNPLSAILYGIDTVIRYLPPGVPVARRSAEVIQRSARQINRLIGDILDVARIDVGNLALDCAAVWPAEVVAEALETVRPLAGGLILAGTIPPDLPPVWADRGRVLQVLGNLLGNAIKFTPPGGRISVLAERRDHAVLFHVRDTGPGIPPEQLEHIFDRFWQADRADRRGAGLGLAIVKGIVEAHSGAVSVDSRPGAGTSFHFTLPLARA